jgi:hypothetical protein
LLVDALRHRVLAAAVCDETLLKDPPSRQEAPIGAADVKGEMGQNLCGSGLRQAGAIRTWLSVSGNLNPCPNPAFRTVLANVPSCPFSSIPRASGSTWSRVGHVSHCSHVPTLSTSRGDDDLAQKKIGDACNRSQGQHRVSPKSRRIKSLLPSPQRPGIGSGSLSS